MHQSNDIAPKIVELKDTDGETYTVDKDISYLLTNRHVWTDDQGVLYVREEPSDGRGAPYERPLCIWVLRIMSSQALSYKSNLTRYQYVRDMTYIHLDRIWRGVV